ncbi:MAG: DUF2304 domain-containing protein [Erysipelotrichaceae bacterium]
MSLELQILMFVIAICVAVFIIHQSRVSRLNVRYAIIWIGGVIGVLILSVFPKILSFLADLFRISTPVTTLFFLTIMVLYILLFYAFIKISTLENRVNNLTYENALLQKKVDDEK